MFRWTFVALGIGLFAAGFALTPAQAESESPYGKPDDSWISISGTVAAPEDESFMLDYGEGVILVEMDDWDSYGDAYGLFEGDKVTVYGRIDDDLFENTKIEAGSVYVEDLNTYFYASPADEEGAISWTVTAPIIISQTTIIGTVTSVDVAEREFTLDTGASEVTVEAEFVGYNPVDDIGYQQIDVGDQVSVTGILDDDFLEGRVLEADTIVTLQDDS